MPKKVSSKKVIKLTPEPELTAEIVKNTNLAIFEEGSKPWWQSSTIWINITPLVVLLLQSILDSYVLSPQTVVVLTTVINIFNRLRAPEQIKSLSLN